MQALPKYHQADANAFENRKVLIVSGDEAILHLCSYLIFDAGMRAYTSLEPTDAFTVLAHVDMGMVVTELDFAAHTGIDLVHHVRTNYPQARTLVMTPFGDAGGAVKAIRGGADDFLMKPFSAAEFRQKLANWSDRREVYSNWSRSQKIGLPEERSLGGDQKRLLQGLKRIREDNTALRAEPNARHTAILCDAVRTLAQIIERDIEETAIFANIDEDELRSAFFAANNDSRTIRSPSPAE
jgi:ActR/RegA family two-component response regulator